MAVVFCCIGISRSAGLYDESATLSLKDFSAFSVTLTNYFAIYWSMRRSTGSGMAGALQHSSLLPWIWDCTTNPSVA